MSKLTCPHCPKTFDDAEWLKLHQTAQHGRERETKQRGKGGGRKPASHAVHNNTNWTNSAPSSVSLMNHYRPAEKPLFESEPVTVEPEPLPKFNFNLRKAPRDVVHEYRRDNSARIQAHKAYVKKG